jgi:GT2 family glycosyltransferase
MKPERISIAILSWNGRVHLETCLDALSDQADPGVPWEILVLDNGSADGTAEWLRRTHPRVRCLRSETNLGFCAGNNRLVEEARGDAVALLNNDTRPRPDWLTNLNAALGQAPPDVAAVSGLIVDWAGERLDFARGLMTFDAHALQEGFRRPLERVSLPAEGSELLFGCGGNMLVRKESFLAAGGFDADYFAYYEDVDLGWRLWQGGERVLFAPAAVVHHRSSATSDLLGLYNRGFLFERNAWLTAYKNYEDAWWRKLMPAILLTMQSRTQTLLAGNNPGGDLLSLDPYAGLIADTAGGERPAEPSLGEKWRSYGARDFFRRAGRRARRWLAGFDHAPRLTDERTVAQLRVQAYLLRHLDQAAEKRRQVQSRRRRSDREIFERFPLALVPTYPGDEALFASPGFRSWLPADLPLVEKRLADLVELG